MADATQPNILPASSGAADASARDAPTTDHASTRATTDVTHDRIRAPASSLGKYVITRPLGGGSQATAYLAHDPDLRRQVVLKHYHSAGTDAEAQRVLEEGRALARIASPFVAKCHGAERHDGHPFLVIEYVPGQPLHQARAVLDAEICDKVRVVRQIVDGLAAVHARGLIHRDLKPANILIDDAGRPRIIDFGLAAHLASAKLESLSGTLSYMPPEQARQEFDRVDFRSDLFGVGAVLYFLLTGHPPYKAGDTKTLLAMAREGRVRPVRELNEQIPASLATICDRCLATDPAQRPPSALHLGERLDEWLNRHSSARRRLLRWVAAGAVIAFLAVLLWGAWSWLPAWLHAPKRQDLRAVPGVAGQTPPGQVKPTANAASASKPRHPDGRELRSDFPLTVEFSGAARDAQGRLKLMAGDVIALRISAQRDCYLRVWSVQEAEVLQVYPNQSEPDHILKAGETRLVPGGATAPGETPLQLKAQESRGFEFLHVLAATQPLSQAEGKSLGPYVLFQKEQVPEWQRTGRGFVLKEAGTQDGPLAISEVIVPVEVAAAAKESSGQP